MSVSVNNFIKVLKEEVEHWKEAALRCDSVVASLPAERQKIEWIMIAASYRHRAKDLEKMIDELRSAEGSH